MPGMGHTYNPPRFLDDHCYQVGLLVGNSPEERHRARIACACNATGPDDLALLLDALDLWEPAA